MKCLLISTSITQERDQVFDTFESEYEHESFTFQFSITRQNGRNYNGQTAKSFRNKCDYTVLETSVTSPCKINRNSFNVKKDSNLSQLPTPTPWTTPYDVPSSPPPPSSYPLQES